MFQQLISLTVKNTPCFLLESLWSQHLAICSPRLLPLEQRDILNPGLSPTEDTSRLCCKTPLTIYCDKLNRLEPQARHSSPPIILLVVFICTLHTEYSEASSQPLSAIYIKWDQNDTNCSYLQLTVCISKVFSCIFSTALG